MELVRTVLAIAWTTLAVSLSAQVYRGGVTAFVIDVVAEGRDGEMVNDLTKDDFEVLDDGRPAEILSSALVSLRTSEPTPSDVWTNVDTGARRVFIVVVDDLNTRPDEIGRARDVVRRFVAAVPSGDLISVVYCGHQGGSQEFTADKARVLKALDSFSGRQPDPDEALLGGESQHNQLRVFATLQNAARYVAGIPERRKALLFVTSGLPLDLESAMRSHGAIADSYRTLLSIAATANVAIYPVDYAGLSARSSPMLGALRALARDTGGFATENTNDFTRAFSRVVRESTAYYLIGYTPAGDGRGPKTRIRSVSVRVKRLGVVARSRQAYSTREEFTGAGKPSRFPDAPLSSGRIPVRMHVAWIATARKQARLVSTLEIPAAAMQLARRGDKYSASLRFRVAASDVYGKVIGADSRKLIFTVTPARRDQMAELGSRALSSLDLQPGSYRLRGVLVDDSSGDYGIVTGDIDIPDVTRIKSSTMSGIFVSSRDSSAMPTLRENASAFEDHLLGPPTAERSFQRGDELDLYAEAYAPPGFPEHPRATLAVVDTEGRPAIEQANVLQAGKGIAGAQCFPVRFRLKLNRFEPGRYVVRLAVEIGTGRSLGELSVLVR